MKAAMGFLLTSLFRVPGARLFAAAVGVWMVCGFAMMQSMEATKRNMEQFILSPGQAIFGWVSLVVPCALAYLAGRLAGTRAVRLLPHGQLKVLLTSFLTLLLIDVALRMILWRGSMPAEFDSEKLLLPILFTSLVFAAVYAATAVRTVASAARLLLVGVALVGVSALPGRSATSVVIVLQILLTWAGIAWLFVPRRSGGGWPRAPEWFRSLGSVSYVAGHEARMLLASTRQRFPAAVWLFPLLVMVFPLLLLFLWDRINLPIQMSIVLLILACVAVMLAGGLSSRAASQSRLLWLRMPETREDIFRRVEALQWRKNTAMLLVAIALFVALAAVHGAPMDTLLWGGPHLLVMVAGYTYLGLLLLRPAGWFEWSIAIVLGWMLVCMFDGPGVAAVLFEVALIAVVVLLRFAARARWMDTDLSAGNQRR